MSMQTLAVNFKATLGSNSLVCTYYVVQHGLVSGLWESSSLSMI